MKLFTDMSFSRMKMTSNSLINIYNTVDLANTWWILGVRIAGLAPVRNA